MNDAWYHERQTSQYDFLSMYFLDHDVDLIDVENEKSYSCTHPLCLHGTYGTTLSVHHSELNLCFYY
jgi:hypothetical protein